MSLTLTARLARWGAALMVAGLMAGCSALSAVQNATTTLEVYELRAAAGGPVARGAPRPVALIVELPTTSGALDTDRIMIRPGPLQAQYLPDVRWSETAPVMVQRLMLRSIEDTQGFRYVGRRPIGPGGDYALISELTDFQAEALAPGGAVVTLRLTARLVREEDVEIVASRTFTATAAVASTGTPALVDGFDRASRLLMNEIAEWTLDALDVGFARTSVAGDAELAREI
ncbi:ABC-type transport auxiliary lipoprotein family protein [Rubellimicrobium aerolatum]|uniref:ABC-type transport auxiliary lipoprotein family protein n=1 Tax=Rubellimicrobium aerolatum TaxID=490979 RepID=A0ABW0SAF9_9RHOB|nr:ABC-type transport auxiliary lipoprotein family protein [Rubellimicrobium aerolatum]MBP1805248.1 cholesterol transport system auxiliary component [Rubellimicrobium aerolatum]